MVQFWWHCNPLARMGVAFSLPFANTESHEIFLIYHNTIFFLYLFRYDVLHNSCDDLGMSGSPTINTFQEKLWLNSRWSTFVGLQL